MAKDKRKHIWGIVLIVIVLLLVIVLFGRRFWMQESVISEGSYENRKWNFALDMPANWNGKYQVTNWENCYFFLQTATYEKYGEGFGCLFYIECIEGEKTQEEVDEAVSGILPWQIIMRANGKTYVYGTPTDVQYPIWSDRDEEDVAIAEEYEAMFAEIPNIVESIHSIR